jgi:hypothetical protein
VWIRTHRVPPRNAGTGRRPEIESDARGGLTDPQGFLATSAVERDGVQTVATTMVTA